MAEPTDKCSVRVAIRIRPQSMNQRNEREDNFGMCPVVVLSRFQIAIGEDKVFTFDHVFDEQAEQVEIFDRCIKQLVEATFDGYNATVLAYGQTGSGKTFTMGTSFKRTSKENIGIIPRAAEYLFDKIKQKKLEARANNQAQPMFEVVVQFIEDGSDSIDLNSLNVGIEVFYSKLHFVDLAGSERLKKTGATGDRAKEGISINSGLLSLGNVISILGAASGGRLMHVPYRDSKLTRLLQDSLGGNSRTLMIACVSSNFADHAETLSTLQYANRAKNIKNKVVVNQEKKMDETKMDKDVVVVGVEPEQGGYCFSTDDWFKEVEDVVSLGSPSTQLSDSPPKMRDFYTNRMRVHQEYKSVADIAGNAFWKTTLQYLCAGDFDKMKVGQLWIELQRAKAENKLTKIQNEDYKRKNAELERQLAVYKSTNVPIEVKETKEQQCGFQKLRVARKDAFSRMQCLPEVKPRHIAKGAIACNQFAVPEIKTRKSNKHTRTTSNGASSGMETLPSDCADSECAVQGQANQAPRTTRRSRSVGSTLRGQSPRRMFHDVRAYFEGKCRRQPSQNRRYEPTSKTLQQQFRF